MSSIKFQYLLFVVLQCCHLAASVSYLECRFLLAASDSRIMIVGLSGDSRVGYFNIIKIILSDNEKTHAQIYASPLAWFRSLSVGATITYNWWLLALP